MKKSRLLNILCSMLVGVIFMIAMIAVMIFSGAVSLQRTEVTFATESASAVYDGKPLTNHKWTLVSGELKNGHRAQVTVTGSQTAPGESDNSLKVKILDAAGADVTGDYTINYDLGKLKVTSRELVVTSKGAKKDFDGTPLVNPDYEITGLIPGHKAVVLVTGSQTKAGYSSNTIQAIKILDRVGADVTNNYNITKKEEPLIVSEKGGTSFDNIENDLDPEELAKTILYNVTSNTVGKLYMKTKSFGEYHGKGFYDAEQYTPLIDSKLAASYLSSYALWSKGASTGRVTIKPMPKSSYVLPYNMTIKTSDGYEIQTDDRGSVGFADEYIVDYYISDFGSAVGDTFIYNQYEQEYRKFVYQNYTYVDPETEAYMNSVIAKNGLNSRSANADIIKKVADFIMGSATYSFEYDRKLDECSNIAISFLRDYKEGVCRHYAMAATMLYRALDIPARYTEGVVAHIKTPGEEVQVSALNVHAWVEVYIDGFGWQMVEVTGGNSAGGNMIGAGGIDFSNLPNADLTEKELENIKLLTVNAQISGPIYLKSVSYGEYAGHGFQPAVSYDRLLNGQYAASYLTSFALKSAQQNLIWIKNRAEGVPYVLPYYMYTNTFSGYNIQKDDTKSIGSASSYYISAYDYKETPVKHTLYTYVNYEREYAAFVKAKDSQYMKIEGETAEYMKAIIEKEGFNANDPKIINKVAKYIQNAATYNFDYDKDIDKSSDIAIAFLDAGEGVCRHYAAAATMLYRALGIPARYTEGIKVNAVAKQDVVANALMYHAWVEVYVDGIGWQMVEVTGGDIIPDKEIAPEDIYMYSGDGNVLDASAVTTLADFEKKYPGYSYEGLVVEGTQFGLGTSNSTISNVTIYDKDGNDVTAEFIFMPGKVQIYRDIFKPVDVEMQYDGMSVLLPKKELAGFEKYAEQGYSIDYSTFYVEGARIEPGITESTVKEGIVIRDMFGNDVTGEFKFEEGKIHVYRGVLSPLDTEKRYDGTPLVYTDSYPDMMLKNFDQYRWLGYNITQLTVSQQTEPGKYESIIENVEIRDRYGKDVTNEFKFDKGQMHIYREVLYPFYIQKQYDGEAFDYMNHINNMMEYNSYYESILEGFAWCASDLGYSIAELKVSSFTEPGKHWIGIENIVIRDAGGVDVTDEFKFETGRLHIYREYLYPFYAEKQYDGKPFDYMSYVNLMKESDSNYEYILENFKKFADELGYSITELKVSTFTKPGKHWIGIENIVIRDAGGKDVTDEFLCLGSTNMLHIYREILYPNDVEKKYDGNPLVYTDNYQPQMSGGYMIYPSNALMHFEKYAIQLNYRITGLSVSQQSEPGKYETWIEHIEICDANGNAYNADGQPIADEFKFETGEMHIYREILYPFVVTKPYDGTPINYTDIKDTLCVYIDGVQRRFDEYTNEYSITEFTVEQLPAKGSYVDIGYYQSKITSITMQDAFGNQYNANGQPITNEFKFADGEMAIVKRGLDVKSNDIEFIIGDAVPERIVDVINGSLLDGHRLHVEFLDDEVNYNKVGTYPNKFSLSGYCVLDEYGNDVTHLYQIASSDYGTIAIKRREITVVTGSAEENVFKLNNTPLTCPEAGIDFESVYPLMDGDKIVVIESSISSQLNIGKSENILTVEIVNSEGKNVTSNYDITYKYGTLTVYFDPTAM